MQPVFFLIINVCAIFKYLFLSYVFFVKRERAKRFLSFEQSTELSRLLSMIKIFRYIGQRGKSDITFGVCRLSKFRGEMFARCQATSNNTFVPVVFQYSQRCAATIETRQATRLFVCVANKIEHGWYRVYRKFFFPSNLL